MPRSKPSRPDDTFPARCRWPNIDAPEVQCSGAVVGAIGVDEAGNGCADDPPPFVRPACQDHINDAKCLLGWFTLLFSECPPTIEVGWASFGTVDDPARGKPDLPDDTDAYECQDCRRLFWMKTLAEAHADEKGHRLLDVSLGDDL